MTTLATALHVRHEIDKILTNYLDHRFETSGFVSTEDFAGTAEIRQKLNDLFDIFLEAQADDEALSLKVFVKIATVLLLEKTWQLPSVCADVTKFISENGGFQGFLDEY